MAGAGLAYVAVAHTGMPLRGYGVPAATDVAFAMAALSLFGRRIPLPLRLFVLALAVVDDLASLAVLVLGYSARLDPARLGVAVGAVVVGLVLRRAWADHPLLVALLGLVCWLALVGSGVEPALAGVLAGVLARSPLHGGPTRLEAGLRPLVNAAVLPAFALGNAGVALGSISPGHGAGVVLGAVLVARIVGKAGGIVLATFMAARLVRGRLPGGVRVRSLAGVGALCGVGFTVPLLVAGRAFAGHPELLGAARLGLLAGSVGAFVLGATLLLWPARGRGSSRPDAGGR
jgi:NhaA family Na+:H+ antiporter